MSFRACAVSVCFAIASICVMLTYRISSHDRTVRELISSTPADEIVLDNLYSDEYGTWLVSVLGIEALLFVALGLAPIVMRRFSCYKLWVFLVGCAALLAIAGFYQWEYSGWQRYFADAYAGHRAGHTSILWENLAMSLNMSEQLLKSPIFRATMLSFYCIGIAVGFLAAAAFIIVTRRTLQLSSQLTSTLQIAGIIILNCLIAVALSFGPASSAYLVARVITPSWPRFNNDGVLTKQIIAGGISEAGYVASLSSALMLVIAMLVMLLVVALLLHRLLWPLLQRPLYALQAIGIARRRKLLAAIGIALIGVGLGVTPAWLKTVVESLAP